MTTTSPNATLVLSTLMPPSVRLDHALDRCWPHDRFPKAGPWGRNVEHGTAPIISLTSSRPKSPTKEAKLVELRNKFAAATPAGRLTVKPPPAVDTDALVADLRCLRTLRTWRSQPRSSRRIDFTNFISASIVSPMAPAGANGSISARLANINFQ